MSEQDYGRIIGANLKRLAWERRKTQADISRDLGFFRCGFRNLQIPTLFII